MDKRFLNLLGFGFIVLAMLGIAVALIGRAADIVAAHKEVGDLATWVGAIGTVLTLVGTIFLATQERRRSHREVFTNARLIAAGLSLRVVNAQGAMKNAAKFLEPFAVMDAGDEPLRKALLELDSCPVWSSQEVAPIQFYDPVLALKLIEFMTQFEMAKSSLRAHLSGVEGRLSLDRQDFGHKLGELMRKSVEEIDGRAEECLAAGTQISADFSVRQR